MDEALVYAPGALGRHETTALVIVGLLIGAAFVVDGLREL